MVSWARGASLATTLDIADLETGRMSPGDFVRNAKQVVDVLEQISRVPAAECADVAYEAIGLIQRSIIAGPGSIHHF
jgi:ATP-dependent RNA helicase HelY